MRAGAEGIAAVLLSGTCRQSALELKALQCMATSGAEGAEAGCELELRFGCQEGVCAGSGCAAATETALSVPAGVRGRLEGATGDSTAGLNRAGGAPSLEGFLWSHSVPGWTCPEQTSPSVGVGTR